jgi:predicted HTH transcriptional regulator
LQKDEENNDEDDGNEEKEGLTEGQALRQNRIIEYLKEKGQAQVWEIQKIFPDISKRTIRRDFRSLLKQGLIERIGERNRTYYKLKVNIS